MSQIQKSGEQETSLVVAGADAFFAAPTVPNVDQSERMIPVLHLYQGTTEEADTFGPGFAVGDLLDKIEKRKTATRNIAVIRGVRRWKKWVEGSNIPVYDYDNINDVPDGESEWTGEGENRTPPLATETYEYMVMVQGEPFPYVFRFKVTSLEQGKLLYELCERAKAKRRFGLYEVGFIKEKGKKGSYAVPQLRDIGNAPEDMAKEVVGWFGRLSAGAKVKVQSEGGATTVDDGVPI